MLFGAPALAATFIYVSNAEDGDIGMYALQADGSLKAGQRFKAGTRFSEKIMLEQG